LVHHGGIGTVAQALAAGIPQLGVPLSHDQFDNTARLMRLGVGRSLPAAHYAAARAAPLLHEILTSRAVAQAGADCAARIRADQPMTIACDLIEGLTNQTGKGM
jgi:UDP:flavonoid glycosyltransferase YjiC (YdhE family)